ncbi:MAG TPA: PspC domain-containing protein [Clostridiales bacterium]|nr:PspC domain-containing protein [Clostridiales bacterium]HPV01480.1 PspC domain-containing protein [Clostridiales bacterium]
MRRLRRSRRNKVILGVCGGLAEYLNIDVVIVRIVAVLSLFMGWGFIIYIIAALIMPEDREHIPDGNGWGHGGGSAGYSGAYSDPGMGTGTDYDLGNDYFSNDDSWDRPARYDSEKTKYIIGAVLIGIGVIALGRELLPGVFELRYTLPVLLIAIGGIILYRGRR